MGGAETEAIRTDETATGLYRGLQKEKLLTQKEREAEVGVQWVEVPRENV